MTLKVIIVGAGLGGLSAAIAFTRAGHDVKVYEKSAFHNEVGAAIHLAPNATRILKPWGCDLEAMQPTTCNHLSSWDYKGNFIATPAITKDLQKKLSIEDPWLLVHRVDLHNALRKKAEEGFAGKKPEIHLSCAVESVDPSTGTVILEDGRVLQADLIIGADGVHSRTVKSIIGEVQKRSTGQNCFRFLVPTDKLQANPITKSLMDRIGLQSLNAFNSEDRRLILYPCRAGTLINAAVFYPDNADGQTIESSWQNFGNVDDLLAEIESFAPELRELCSMAEDVKLWSLASRDPSPVFFKGKLAIIGDAAHPTLPHQGQGGAQAIEDAATLGALFTATTTLDQIGKRLEAYNNIRYEKAVTILFMSRVGDEHREVVMEDLRRFVPGAKMPTNMWLYAWNSFPVQAAQDFLRQQ
ncbi:salicylate 1-monooxygenase [Alternaria burnsii]|uniref:Salicylate 1-monooxygenase n=1 Tax=Alternaria burnsii TaxID=1187904 RepID=A0A8H7BCV4_9PLEO|nr:salicylate 1-monooxygenase [Alternaria burnsii]KAF7679750.1 salicylate 1-monooxygenase [Alternaria burnsii]